jgi:SAM-dependent methyltransferase
LFLLLVARPPGVIYCNNQNASHATFWRFKKRSPGVPVSTPSPNRHDFHNRWSALTPPLRPGPEVAAAMRPFFNNLRGAALQLGVTPELAHLSESGLAADLSEAMVRLAWPGNTSTHRAIVANWLSLPLNDSSISIAFGDACLSVLSWPDEYQSFFQSMRRVLRPGGILLLRCFAGPDDAEPLAALATATFAGRITHFSAFKLRLNMAAYHLAGATPNTGAHIHRIFQTQFPDRPRLAQATGWSTAEIASIDSYENASSLHSYPTRAQLISRLPPGTRHRFVETSGYELSERCPLLALEFTDAD